MDAKTVAEIGYCGLMMASEVISPTQPQIFHPSAGILGIPEAIILHLFGLETVEILTLNKFYPDSASPNYN
jgi:hypothetical protein